jgi:DNA mismatch endonuclease, patch repair protein
MAKLLGKLSFKGLTPASATASRIARTASAKRHTRCEMILRRELFARGYRYRLTSPSLPGRPDIIFRRAKVVIFCDGDFWHGRNLRSRLRKLARGHNASYWTQKIRRNVERDLCQTESLKTAGWRVLRFWETDILARAPKIADEIERVLQSVNLRETRQTREGRGRTLSRTR